MKIYIAIMLLATQFSFASGEEDVRCLLSHESMVLIAKTEKHPKRRLGYPYLISFNIDKQASRVYKRYKELFIPNKGVDRSIDCKSEEICVAILDDLIKRGITNLDLGPYQVNYKVHKKGFTDYYKRRHAPMSKEEFFRIPESYEYACSYAYNFVERWGDSFKSLAMYHSKTPKHRNKYAKRMYDEYKRSN